MNNFKPNEVVTLKLLGGDEVIGRFVESNEEQLTLSKPRLIGLTQKGITLMPYVVTLNDESKVNFKNHGVMCVGATITELATEYISQTSGLFIPQ